MKSLSNAYSRGHTKHRRLTWTLSVDVSRGVIQEDPATCPCWYINLIMRKASFLRTPHPRLWHITLPSLATAQLNHGLPENNTSYGMTCNNSTWWILQYIKWSVLTTLLGRIRLIRTLIIMNSEFYYKPLKVLQETFIPKDYWNLFTGSTT